MAADVLVLAGTGESLVPRVLFRQSASEGGEIVSLELEKW